MQLDRPTTPIAFGPHQELTERDLAYVQSTFRPATELDAQQTTAGCAPKPAYLLPDGTPMIPANPDAGLAAVQDTHTLRERFTDRWTAAGGAAEDADDAFEAWLGGGYGVCLPSPNPEVILAKGGIAQSIRALISRPAPDEAWWCETLRHSVAAYDALVLPFASVDPERFGQPTSRSALVDDVRERWPEAFAVTR